MSAVGERYAVVDSSVAVKWYCSEDESSVPQALALFAEHLSGRITLVAPAHLPVEVLNALGYRAELTSAQLMTAAHGLAESELLYPAWDADLLAEVAVLARRHKR